LLIFIFILGYIAIAFEDLFKINKAAISLLMGVLCWIILIISNHNINVVEQLQISFSEISSILFFLLGAMTIVELIDAYDGFDLIAQKLSIKNNIFFIAAIVGITFFLSAILDNLTTTIVMITIIRQLIPDKNIRLYLASLIILAANAGGCWSPMGDITTTMLWVGGQISELSIIKKLFLPAIISITIPTTFVALKFRKQRIITAALETLNKQKVSKNQSKLILIIGILLLLLVPFLKTAFHVPPFMGILLGLGILWFITEIINNINGHQQSHLLTVSNALQRIDTPSILFFLGILLSVAALHTNGNLLSLSNYLTATIPNNNIVILILGAISAIIDNVPLVSAVQGMYTLQQYPQDSFMWHFLAYCTGTGGSMLVIGSAAGVAAMGLENIHFGWYLKRFTWLALISYLVGAWVCLMM
jgi:Na+/H+ antiporter NhaD/arsenite permease-like protein